MRGKVMAMCSGIGVAVLLYPSVEWIYNAISKVVIFHLAISRADSWYLFFRTVVPLLVWVPAGMVVGYQVGRRGSVYSVAAVLLYNASLVNVWWEELNMLLGVLKALPSFSGLVSVTEVIAFKAVFLLVAVGSAWAGGLIGQRFYPDT